MMNNTGILVQIIGAVVDADFPQHIENTSQHALPHRHFNRAPRVAHRHPPPQTVRRTHGHGAEESMVVGTGFVQVNGNQVLMVTDLALNSSQIDEGSVERAIQEAQEVLKTRSEMSREEQARFEANLTKQIMMLNFKRKHKSPGR